MISWLKGHVIQGWSNSSKKGIVIACYGIGYEVQLLTKELNGMDHSKVQEIWIHQIQRDDCTNLYGFSSIKQRDLFRTLIGVNGIGAQIGMALLDDLEVEELVAAIQEGNIHLLTNSQGVGKRIAERLVVELKNKINQFNNNEIGVFKNQDKTNYLAKYTEEIKSVLNSLGYLDNEIKDPIDNVTAKEKHNILKIDSYSSEARSALMEKHLKEILITLSKKGT